ncbi:MAG: prefoldin subunit alpha [Thermoplasmata archaeon]
MSGPPPAPDPERQMQEDLLRLDAYRNQLGQLVQQHQFLSASRADHERARETLEGLDRVDPTREILIPLGAEAYLRGTASADRPVLLGIGSGVVAELDREKVVEVLHERTRRLDEAARELDAQIRMLEDRIELISRRIDAIGQGASAPDPDDVGGD